MFSFPAGSVDDHGVALTDAVGFVTDINYSVHDNVFSAFVNGAYNTRDNVTSSLSFRAAYFLNADAQAQGRRAIPYARNGSDFFNIVPARADLTREELVAECEAYLLGLIAPT